MKRLIFLTKYRVHDRRGSSLRRVVLYDVSLGCGNITMVYSVTNKFDVSGSFIQDRTKRSPELMRRNPFSKSILGVFPNDVCHGPGADSTTHGRNKQSVALFVSEDLFTVKQPVFKLFL